MTILRKNENRYLTVTNSELQTFRSCPQLHHFKYRDGLRAPVRPRALAMGSAVHAGIDAALKVGAHKGGVDAMKAAARAATNDLLDRWNLERTFGVDEPDFASIDEESRENARVADFLAGHFVDVLGRDDVRNLHLVAVEYPFTVPVRDGRGRAMGHELAGVIDALWYDSGFNMLIVDEHKTTAGDPYGVERRLLHDTQTTGYTYAVRELLAQGVIERAFDGTPIPRDASVGHVRFNVLRKHVPREPKINKDGRVSSAAIDTTPEVYRAALDAQSVKRGFPVTDKQRERLAVLEGKGENHVVRFEVFRTEADLERWRAEVYIDAARIRRANRDPKARTRNPGHCSMPWSMRCQYSDLCAEPDSPELRAAFVVVDDPHPEVKAAEEAVEGDEIDVNF